VGGDQRDAVGADQPSGLAVFDAGGDLAGLGDGDGLQRLQHTELGVHRGEVAALVPVLQDRRAGLVGGRLVGDVGLSAALRGFGQGGVDVRGDVVGVGRGPAVQGRRDPQRRIGVAAAQCPP
jgi:hypothetical protein